MRLTLFLAAACCAAGAAASERIQMDAGPHHRTIGVVRSITNVMGEAVTITNTYVEIGSGLNYLENGNWLPAAPLVEADLDGASLKRAAYSAKFKSNLKGAEPVVFRTSDGKVLRTRVMGLSYYDSATGEAVLLAETQDCEGQIVGDNRVLYPDAFDDVSADVEYVMTPGGWEQNVIIRSDLPAPDAFNLSPASTRLQILTEFVDPPAAREAKVARTKDGLTDESFRFGEMHIKPGKAFSTPARIASKDDVRIAKQLRKLNDRNFLIEEMHYTNAQSKLRSLPAGRKGAFFSKPRKGKGTDTMAALIGHLPVVAAAEPSTSKGMTLAKLDAGERPGFLCDYSIIDPLTNFTFKGNCTYLVTNPVYLVGHTVIEGGTVVKSGVSLKQEFSIAFGDGSVECQTGPYKPAVFTSKNDDTIGEILPGSNGSPQPEYASPFYFYTDPGAELHDLRVMYADTAFQFLDYSRVRVCHSQIVQCNKAMTLMVGGYLGNLLIAETPVVLEPWYEEGSIRAEHVTLFQTTLFEQIYPNWWVELFNCLFQSSVIPDPEQVTQTACATSTFDSVGAGAFYLPPKSPLRNAGVTTIDAALKKALAKKTTYPPIMATNLISAESLVLVPQAHRDTDTPDLGYHYDPIDYACSLLLVTNATSANDVSVTLTNGVVVGYFDDQGIVLHGSVEFTSIGTPTNPNRFVDYRTVQEKPVKIGSYTQNSSNVPIAPARMGGDPDAITLRFTHFSRMSGGGSGEYNLIAMNTSWGVTELDVQDCEFLNGDIQISFGVSTSAVLKNNVTEYNDVLILGTMPVVFANNTVRDRYTSFEAYSSATWDIRDVTLRSVLRA
jgi:hypothetical protein